MVHIHHVTEMFSKILGWGLGRLRKNNKGIPLCKHLQFSESVLFSQLCASAFHRTSWTWMNKESGVHILFLHIPFLLISTQELQIYIKLGMITPSYADTNRSLCPHRLCSPQYIGVPGWGQGHVVWRWWDLCRARNVEISVILESSEKFQGESLTPRNAKFKF